VQKHIRWDDDIYTSHADLKEAQNAFTAAIEGLRERVAADPGIQMFDEEVDVILCFSCPSRRYFRHDLLPTYKATRKGERPMVLSDLNAWASEVYETKTKPHLEADDVLGILATHPTLIKGDKIIVSIDKDMQQIAGLHMNPMDGEVFRVREEFAENFLWTQVLTGDTSDNYTGLPGCGPVKAKKILSSDPLFSPEDLVLAAYQKSGLTLEDMTTQVNVARILTATTYDFKNKEPILWQM